LQIKMYPKLQRALESVEEYITSGKEIPPLNRKVFLGFMSKIKKTNGR
jgi:hypothetical protein